MEVHDCLHSKDEYPELVVVGGASQNLEEGVGGPLPLQQQQQLIRPLDPYS